MNDNTGLEDLLQSTKPVELKHYNGEVTMFYDPGIHAYYVAEGPDRYRVAGVTDVVGMIDKSGALTQWAANMAVEWLRQKMFITNGLFPGILVERLEGGQFNDITTNEQLEKLYNEARYNYRQISKTATDIGTMAHDWLDVWIKGLITGVPVNGVLPDNPKAANCINAALAWMEKHKFTPYHAECKVLSRQYYYAGTYDWDAHITTCSDSDCCPPKVYAPGTVLKVLGDFKSSRAIYDEYRVQVSAYVQAVEEEHNSVDYSVPLLRYDAAVILKLGKDDGEFDSLVISRNDLDQDFEGFLGALQLYNWEKKTQLDRKYRKLKASLEKKAAKIAAKPKKVKIPKEIAA